MSCWGLRVVTGVGFVGHIVCCQLGPGNSFWCAHLVGGCTRSLCDGVLMCYCLGFRSQSCNRAPLILNLFCEHLFFVMIHVELDLVDSQCASLGLHLF